MLKLIYLIIIILVIIYFLYKIYFLIYYQYDNKKIKAIIKNIQKIEIKTHKNLSNTSYNKLHYYLPENLELNNVFSTKNIQMYTIKNDKTFSTQMQIGQTKSKPLKLIKESNKKIQRINLKKIFAKYNIINEFDLIENVVKKNEIQRSIFWSKSKIEIDYILKLLLVEIFGEFENIYIFNNELKGYLVYKEKICYINVFYKKRIYTMYLINYGENLFTESMIKKILQSIYFG